MKQLAGACAWSTLIISVAGAAQQGSQSGGPLTLESVSESGSEGLSEEGLETAIAAVAAGDFGRALSVAVALEDALGRAQAELYVRHQAGDLPGALLAGRAGLASAPRDAWLLERCTYLAISLRAGELGSELAERYVELAESELDAQQGERARSYLVEARELARLELARARALGRARWTVGSCVLGLLAALVALATNRKSPRQRVVVSGATDFPRLP